MKLTCYVKHLEIKIIQVVLSWISYCETRNRLLAQKLCQDMFFAWSRGCFGCYSKPTPIIAVDEPSKGLRIQGHAVKQPSFSDGFWSSSTFDLDHSTLQSQRNHSSMSTSALNLRHSMGSVSSEPEFINHGSSHIHKSL